MNKEDEINELKLRVQKVEKILAEQETLLLSTSEALKESTNILIDFIKNYTGPRKLDIN